MKKKFETPVVEISEIEKFDICDGSKCNADLDGVCPIDGTCYEYGVCDDDF